MDLEHSSDDSAPETRHKARQLAAQLVSRRQPVVLVGMMGVGKSSVGRRLAALLEGAFLDADEEIEKAAGLTIPEIFERYGEAAFRDGERRVIARLMGAADSLGAPAADHPLAALPPEPETDTAPLRVIATGGGAFCNPETRALILRRGVAVWLDADLDTLVERTARKDNRPLLRTGNPREILARLKATRAPFYAEAPIHLLSGNMPHARTLAILVEALLAHLAPTPQTGTHS